MDLFSCCPTIARELREMILFLLEKGVKDIALFGEAVYNDTPARIKFAVENFPNRRGYIEDIEFMLKLRSTFTVELIPAYLVSEWTLLPLTGEKLGQEESLQLIKYRN